jgi:hypothetical protein
MVGKERFQSALHFSDAKPRCIFREIPVMYFLTIGRNFLFRIKYTKGLTIVESFASKTDISVMRIGTSPFRPYAVNKLTTAFILNKKFRPIVRKYITGISLKIQRGFASLAG